MTEQTESTSMKKGEQPRGKAHRREPGQLSLGNQRAEQQWLPNSHPCVAQHRLLEDHPKRGAIILIRHHRIAKPNTSTQDAFQPKRV